LADAHEEGRFPVEFLFFGWDDLGGEEECAGDEEKSRNEDGVGVGGFKHVTKRGEDEDDGGDGSQAKPEDPVAFFFPPEFFPEIKDDREEGADVKDDLEENA